MVLGMGSFYGLRHWLFRPVDQAITLTRGTVGTGNFRLIKADEYMVTVLVDRTAVNDPRCPASPDWEYHSVLKGRWTVFKDGQPYTSGTFDFDSYWLEESFDADPGTYQLEVEVLSDASCLQKLHPRLVVEAVQYPYGFWSELLGWSSLICFASGVVILGCVLVDKRRDEKVHTGVNGVEQVGPVIAQPGVRRPLRARIEGLPGFGTVATLVMFVVLMPVWISFSLHNIPTGIFVRVSSKEYLRATANRSVGPLIVSVERRRETVVYLIDGNEVSVADLHDALKRELSRRADWVVFVEGDEDLPYQDIVQVIDIANGLHARSVMLTAQMKQGH